MNIHAGLTPEIDDLERRRDALAKLGARFVIESDLTAGGGLVLHVHPYDGDRYANDGTLVGVVGVGEQADRLVRLGRRTTDFDRRPPQFRFSEVA